jgi:hypothetical protein
MGKTKELPAYPRGITFEQVWAALMENREQMKESAERHEREMKEYAEQQKEYAEQQEKRSKRIDEQIGKFSNSFGEMVEYMVKPNLVAKFSELGFVFEKAYSDATIKDKTNNIYTEVDITLENGDKVMLVEVKNKPKTEDVTEHLERIEKVRRHADFHGDKRKFLGAIAGVVFIDNVKQFAMKNGFYIIEPSGETFSITVPEGEYSPREW